MDTPNNEFMSAALAVAKNGLLVQTGLHSTLHLVAAPFAPGPGLDPGTLTVPTYDGYAPVNVDTWGTEHILPNGNYVINSLATCVFAPTGTTTSNTIYGWYLLDTAGNCVSQGLLPNPVVMAGPGNVITIVPAVGFGPWAVTSTTIP